MIHLKSVTVVVTICFAPLIWGSLYDNYCWKDYDGTKPSKALNAGIDKSGRIINIGQILHENVLMVGEVYENAPNILYELGGAKIGTENIRVMCTDHPQKFQWYPTKFTEVENLTDKVLVKGAFLTGFDIYIGRKFVDGELRVGKVTCGVSCDTFRLAHFNGSTSYHEDFEILTYND